MQDSEDNGRSFDDRLIAAAFALIAERGWSRLSVAAAAQRAGLPLAEARREFPSRLAVLMRFGRRADQAALTGPVAGGVRDALFDSLMRRIDALQAERAGMIALLRDLPRDPLLAAFLAAASLRSMGWLLATAGVETGGIAGGLRANGLLAVWLATVRAWMGDESEDLAATMAALDHALDRAGRFAGWLGASTATTGEEEVRPAEEAPELSLPETGSFAPPEPPVSPPPDSPPPVSPL